MDLALAIIIYLAVFLVMLLLVILLSMYFNSRVRKFQQQNKQYKLIENIKTDETNLSESEIQMFISKMMIFHKNSNNQLNFTGYDTEYQLMEGKMPNAEPKIMQKIINMGDEQLGIVKHSSSKESTPKISNHNITKYTYIRQMVLYTGSYVEIVENLVREIYKEGEYIKEIGQKKKYLIGQSDQDFKSSLEYYGFQVGQPGSYKFQVTVDVPNMRTGEHYLLKSLKQSSQKQQINRQEFDDYTNPLQRANTLDNLC